MTSGASKNYRDKFRNTNCLYQSSCYSKVYVCCLFVFDATAPCRPGSPHSRGFYITLNHAPQSVGLLWTSDQCVAETSTWQHTTLTTNTHVPGGIRTPILRGERRQSYALDYVATGTGKVRYNHTVYLYVCKAVETNSRYFPTRYWMTGFYKRELMCERWCVYCAVRTASTYLIRTNFHLQKDE